MIVYLCILTFLFLATLINNRGQMVWDSVKNQYAGPQKHSAVLFISVTLVYFLMALKSPVSGDYSQYAVHFINSEYRTVADMANNKGEQGFHALTKFINTFTGNPSWYFAITSAIICISLFHFIRKHADNQKYALYFYFTIGLFAFSLAGLRQALAMSICLFAYDAIKEKKLLKFFIIVLIAFFFHKSAVFFLPAYFIARFKWKKESVFLVTLLYGIILVFFNSLYYSIATWLNYDNYSIESTGNGGIFLIILLVISALCLIYKDKLLLKDSSNIIFINLHLTVLAMWVFRMFTRTVERPAFYYLYATIIVLDKIFSLQLDTEEENNTLKILILSALILFGLFFMYRLMRDRNLIPYVFI